MSGKVDLNEILNLECKIYIPTLRESEINITKEQRLKALNKPESITTYYVNNKLVGIFRFSKKGDTAFILSLLYKLKGHSLQKALLLKLS